LTLAPLAPDTASEYTGILIISADRGSGIGDAQCVFGDGYSTRGSLGYGLGTVNRLMDSVTVESNSENGTYIRCERRIRPPRSSPTPARVCAALDIGAATRALPGAGVNGDAFVIIEWAEGALFGVIDGIGHGKEAHRAACAVRQYVESHFDRPLTELFAGSERACHGTRGVVMALARFDAAPETTQEMSQKAQQLRLTFASVGNIETRVYGGTKPLRLLVRRGILGMPRSSVPPAVTTSLWCADHILILHSDGVRSHWSFDSFPEFITQSADQVASTLLKYMGRLEDDATVLVIKNKSR